MMTMKRIKHDKVGQPVARSLVLKGCWLHIEDFQLERLHSTAWVNAEPIRSVRWITFTLGQSCPWCSQFWFRRSSESRWCMCRLNSKEFVSHFWTSLKPWQDWFHSKIHQNSHHLRWYTCMHEPSIQYIHIYTHYIEFKYECWIALALRHPWSWDEIEISDSDGLWTPWGIKFWWEPPCTTLTSWRIVRTMLKVPGCRRDVLGPWGYVRI